MAWWIPLSIGLSALSEYLGAEAEEETLERQLTEREKGRGRAREIIGKYQPGVFSEEYTPYASPLAPQRQATLAQFLSGELTPAQTGVLAQQRRLGEGAISRRVAGAGTPMGGRAALSVQLARDLALQGATLAGQQQQFGLQAALPYEQAARAERQYGYESRLAKWLKGQEEESRRRELELQYLT